MSSNESNQNTKSLIEQFTINALYRAMKDKCELYEKLKEKSVDEFTEVLKLMEASPNMPKEVLNEYKVKSAAILQPQQSAEEESKTAIRQQTSHTTFVSVAQASHTAQTQDSIETQSQAKIESPPQAPIESQPQALIEVQSHAPMDAQSQAQIEAPAETNVPNNSEIENSTDQQQTATVTSSMDEEPDDSAAQSTQNLSKRGKFIIQSVTCPESNCGEQFASMRELEMHLFKKHKIKHFPCPQNTCVASFHTKTQLMLHKEQKHRRVAVWQCKICKRKFENTTKCPDRFEGLIRHYKENHYLGEYKCIRCDTISASQAKANRHYDIKCSAKPTKLRTVQIYDPEQQQPPQPHSQQPNVHMYSHHAMPNGMFTLMPNLMQSALNLKMSTATTVTDFFSVRPRNASSQSRQQQTGQNQQNFPAQIPTGFHISRKAVTSLSPVCSIGKLEIGNPIKFVKGFSKLDNKMAHLSKK